MRAFRWTMHSTFGVAAMAAANAAGAVGGGIGLVIDTWASGPVFESRGIELLPTLQSRIALSMNAPVGTNPTLAPQRIVSARLLGDYYFSRPSISNGRVSGFRATGGVLLGPRLGTWSMSQTSITYDTSTVTIERRNFGLLPPLLDAVDRDAGSAVPYVGVGYSNVFDKGRWGVSADLGLIALRPSGGGLRLGRAFGVQTSDDSLRDLRLAPMLQLGVSYSF